MGKEDNKQMIRAKWNRSKKHTGHINSLDQWSRCSSSGTKNRRRRASRTQRPMKGGALKDEDPFFRLVSFSIFFFRFGTTSVHFQSPRLSDTLVIICDHRQSRSFIDVVLLGDSNLPSPFPSSSSSPITHEILLLLLSLALLHSDSSVTYFRA